MAQSGTTNAAEGQFPTPPEQFHYSRWRHGGWYVHNVRYPNGAIGCVSRNYDDHKWRIACHPSPIEEQPTFKTRDEAARAEWLMAQAEAEQAGQQPGRPDQPSPDQPEDGVYRFEAQLFATVYVRADCTRSEVTAEAEAREFIKGQGFTFEGEDISDLRFDDPDLPAISLAPAMTGGDLLPQREPGVHPYVMVIGRYHGDDDDSYVVYANVTCQEARDAFKRQTVEDLHANDRHGHYVQEKVYINYVFGMESQPKLLKDMGAKS